MEKTKPEHWLDVEFGCDRCHMREHAKESTR